MARRWGNVCFWVVIDGARLPVNDLSLEGFSVPFGAPLVEPRQVGFELSLDGIPERIFGVAETMNFTVGTDGGCSAAASSPSRATARSACTTG